MVSKPAIVVKDLHEAGNHYPNYNASLINILVLLDSLRGLRHFGFVLFFLLVIWLKFVNF